MDILLCIFILYQKIKSLFNLVCINFSHNIKDQLNYYNLHLGLKTKETNLKTLNLTLKITPIVPSVTKKSDSFAVNFLKTPKLSLHVSLMLIHKKPREIKIPKVVWRVQKEIKKVKKRNRHKTYEHGKDPTKNILLIKNNKQFNWYNYYLLLLD